MRTIKLRSLVATLALLVHGFAALPAGAADRNSQMFRNMGGGFRQKQESFELWQLLLWMVALVAVFYGLKLLARLMSRRERVPYFTNPRSLFRALCRAHALDPASCRLLKQLATLHRLPTSAEIFVRPECFAAAALDTSLSGRREAISALASRLFSRASGDAQPKSVEQPGEELLEAAAAS